MMLGWLRCRVQWLTHTVFAERRAKLIHVCGRVRGHGRAHRCYQCGDTATCPVDVIPVRRSA